MDNDTARDRDTDPIHDCGRDTDKDIDGDTDRNRDTDKTVLSDTKTGFSIL